MDIRNIKERGTYGEIDKTRHMERRNATNKNREREEKWIGDYNVAENKCSLITKKKDIELKPIHFN